VFYLLGLGLPIIGGLLVTLNRGIYAEILIFYRPLVLVPLHLWYLYRSVGRRTNIKEPLVGIG